MRYSFVILHYLAPEVTTECINLLLERFDTAATDIVVVDNASPDGSGPLLQSRYAPQPNVHFVTLDSNEGFARGNNAGYIYAVQNCKPDFVIVMNNDVMIRDGAFLEKIAAQYASEPFAILGPDIYSPKADWHQSPSRLVPMTLRQVRELRGKMQLKYRFHAYKYITWNLKLLLGLKREPAPKDSGSTDIHRGCVLHGACYIFSKDFIAARPLAFNPATFLYTEEDILTYECLRSGLAIRYCPDISVEHLEDVATTRAFQSAYKRSRMKYKRLVESLDVLISLMEEGGDV